MTENLLLGKNQWLETSPKDPRKIKTNPEPKTQFPTSKKLSSIEPLWDGSELNSKWVLFVQASPQSFGGFEGESRNSTVGKTLDSQWGNFKLFGLIYLVYLTKFKLFWALLLKERVTHEPSSRL